MVAELCSLPHHQWYHFQVFLFLFKQHKKTIQIMSRFSDLNHTCSPQTFFSKEKFFLEKKKQVRQEQFVRKLLLPLNLISL